MFSECCMSGCAICVYDLYDDAMSTYQDACAAARDDLRAKGVDEISWPAELRGNLSVSNAKEHQEPSLYKPVDPVKAAFEKMERELEARRAAQQKEGLESVESTERPRPEVGMGTELGGMCRKLSELIIIAIKTNGVSSDRRAFCPT